VGLSRATHTLAIGYTPYTASAALSRARPHPLHIPYTPLTHPLHTPYTPLTHPLHTPQARGLRYLFHGAGSANLGSASLLINEAKVP
jgi:hypothetical protein